MTTSLLHEIIPGWSFRDGANARLDEELLVRAYRFSEEAHRGQTRNSGEPYVMHCIEVAKILADLNRRGATAPRADQQREQLSRAQGTRPECDQPLARTLRRRQLSDR